MLSCTIRLRPAHARTGAGLKGLHGLPRFPGLGSSPRGPVAQTVPLRASAGQTSALTPTRCDRTVSTEPIVRPKLAIIRISGPYRLPKQPKYVSEQAHRTHVWAPPPQVVWGRSLEKVFLPHFRSILDPFWVHTGQPKTRQNRQPEEETRVQRCVWAILRGGTYLKGGFHGEKVPSESRSGPPSPRPDRFSVFGALRR